MAGFKVLGRGPDCTIDLHQIDFNNGAGLERQDGGNFTDYTFC